VSSRGSVRRLAASTHRRTFGGSSAPAAVALSSILPAALAASLRHSAASGSPAASQTFTVSAYVDRPLLVDGFKFDVRLYVLVTSFDPPRVYLHQQGLARFATRPYSDDPRALSDRFMHLTNYSVNKRAAGFTEGKDEDDAHGHKWGLPALRARLLADPRVGPAGSARLWRNIDQVLLRTVLAAHSSATAGDGSARPRGGAGGATAAASPFGGGAKQRRDRRPTPTRTRAARSDQAPAGAEDWAGKGDDEAAEEDAAAEDFLAREAGDRFQLFGMDVLVDSDLRPWLLEANLAPSMAAAAPLDVGVKSSVLADSLNLACIPVPRRAPPAAGRACRSDATASDGPADMAAEPATDRAADPAVIDRAADLSTLGSAPVRGQRSAEPASSGGEVETAGASGAGSAAAPGSAVAVSPTADDADTASLPASTRAGLLSDLSPEECRAARCAELEFRRRGGFRRLFPNAADPAGLAVMSQLLEAGPHRRRAEALAAYMLRAGDAARGGQAGQEGGLPVPPSVDETKRHAARLLRRRSVDGTAPLPASARRS